MGFELFRLVGNVVLNTSEALTGLSNVENRATRAGEVLGRVGQGVSNFGKALTVGLTLPIVGVLGKSIQLASDLAESANVVNVTFGKSAKEVIAWTKTLNEKFGLVQLEAMKYVGSMGAMLKSSGLSANASREMAQRLVELTGDMSSFYNLSHEETWEKIRAGIGGETEPLKVLGINMSVVNMEAYALSKGINKTWREMSQAEQTTLRYNYILSVTKDAQGDFNRTSEGFANKLRSIQGKLQDVGVKLGTILLPYVEKFLLFIDKWVDKLNGLNPKMQKVAIIVGLLVAAVGPLIGALGLLITVTAGVVTIIGAVGWPVIAAIAGISALIVVIAATIKHFYSWEQIIKGFMGVWNNLKIGFTWVVNFLKSVFMPVFEMFKKTFANFDFKPILKSFRDLKAAIMPSLPLLKELAKVLGFVIAAAIGVAIGLLNGLASSLGSTIAFVGNLAGVVTSVFSLIVSVIRKDSKGINESIKSLWTNIKGAFVNGTKAVLSYVHGFIKGITTFFKNLYNTLVGHSIVPDMINAIVRWFKSLPGKVYSILSSLVSRAINYFSSLKSRAITTISSFVSSAISKIGSFVSNFISKLSSLPGRAASIFNSLKTKASSILGGIASSAFKWGKNLISSFIGGLSSKAGALKNKLSSMAQSAKDFIGWESPTKEGPGKTSDKWGVNLINMLSESMLSKRKQLQDTVRTLSNDIKFDNANVGINSNFGSGIGRNYGQPIQLIIQEPHIYNDRDIDFIFRRLQTKLQTYMNFKKG